MSVEFLNASESRQTPNGTRYWRAGSGESVILIHGVGLDATIWQSQFAAMARDYDVIAYDMLGHGGSPAPNPSATLDDYAKQLEELIEQLALESIAIVGFSMGGLVARLMAIRTPDRVRCLVILAGVFGRNDEQSERLSQRLEEVRRDGPQASVEQAIQRWFTEPWLRENPEKIERIRRLVLGNDPQSYYTSYALFGREDNIGRSQLDRLQMPVLVATGEEDPGSTPEMTRALAQQLPNASWRVLPGMRHMLIMEHPDTVNAMLLAFLAEHHHSPDLERLS
ncbi:alpha/beta fold hydrolase [Salinicola salarius]|uniref:alpha/beta fold hydrolase n=1 Tax=Salinicola salarius TaxID=430457 RepID=UPI0023E3F941|nr:alpha/beta fold hydrolase [Salinicola salarius]MDF3918103.1 alpha/beta fold hydrolase [Salinicola salarius]